MQKLNHTDLEETTQSARRLVPALVKVPVSPAAAAQARVSTLSPALSLILQEVRRELGYQQSEQGGVSTGSASAPEQLITQVAERLGFQLCARERDEILANIERDDQEFGILQPLVDNPQVSDIIVTHHANVVVQQGRKNLRTDLTFSDQRRYEAFVERLLQKAGTSYSTKKPIADGMIGAFARVHVVHRVLCESGPYLTIRLNRFGKVAASDLIENGMAPQLVFDYLCAAVRCGKTLLIVGEVGTGKTTLARAIASSIPPDESILVIEDTPEIRLEHPHVRYVTTREANTDGEGKVPPGECIRAGMRMAMNRIIFGEMRDAEAAEAFIDVCASGHPGLSTIHARSASEAITRLQLFLGRAQKGVAQGVLQEQISTAVQVIAFVDICRISGKRRIMEIKEIGGVGDGTLRQRDLFRYQCEQGAPQWRMVNKVSSFREDLERGSSGVELHRFPAVIDLDPQVLYREAANMRVVQEQ